MDLGAHLDNKEAVEIIRYLGIKSRDQLNKVGIFTVGDLKQEGAIEVYLRLKQAGFPVTLNFLWAMFAGLMDVDLHKLPIEFKEAVKKELDSATQKNTI